MMPVAPSNVRKAPNGVKQFALTVATSFAFVVQGQNAPEPGYPYAAAYLEPGKFTYPERGGEASRLRIFPIEGNEAEVALPITLETFTYNREGTAIYGREKFVFPRPDLRRDLFRIDLTTSAVTAVAGSADFGTINGVAVSEHPHKIVISGNHPVNGKSAWGLLELEPTTGEARLIAIQKIVKHGYPAAWHDLSLSPDAEQVVACTNHAIQVITLQDGTVRTIPGDFSRAAFSPDGKEIAALTLDRNPAVVLLDATDFSRKKLFGETDSQILAWSPDGLYLLLNDSQIRCAPYFESYTILNVQNGKKERMRSSVCKLMGNNGGWVRASAGK